MLKIIRTTADNSDFNKLIEKLNSELRERYVDQETKFAPHNLLNEDVKSIIIYDDELPIACGAFRESEGNNFIEIKRMFTDKLHRSKGLGRKVITELET